MLNIGGELGALAIYAPAALRGKEIDPRRGASDRRTHGDVAERRFNGRAIDAAAFAPLPAGR